MDRCRIGIPVRPATITASESYSNYAPLSQAFPVVSVFGSSTDTIVEGLTPEEANSSGFNVLLDFPGGLTFTVGVDAVSVEFFYIEAIESSSEVTVGRPIPSPYSSACIGPDKMVMVGLDGLIVYSVDSGQTWIRTQSGTSQTLWSITYSQTSGYLASGDGGVLLTSDDGITWSSQTDQEKAPLYATALGRFSAGATERYIKVAGNDLTIGRKIQ